MNLPRCSVNFRRALDYMPPPHSTQRNRLAKSPEGKISVEGVTLVEGNVFASLLRVDYVRVHAKCDVSLSFSSRRQGKALHLFRGTRPLYCLIGVHRSPVSPKVVPCVPRCLAPVTHAMSFAFFLSLCGEDSAGLRRTVFRG